MKRIILTIIMILISVSLIGSSCSEAPAPAPAPAPTPKSSPSPAPEPTTVPATTPASKPTASSWVFEWGGTNFYVYLTSFERKTNTDREGWDKVVALFSIFKVPEERNLDDLFDRPAFENGDGADRGLLEVFVSHYDHFGIRLSWDGGSKDDFRSQTYVNDVYFFQALPATIETDIPSIAKNVKLVPVTDGVKLTSGVTGAPLEWKYRTMCEEYQRLFSKHLLKTFDGFSTSSVGFTEVSRQLEGGYLVIKVDIKNLSMQSDLRIDKSRIVSSPTLLLKADGTLLDKISDDDIQFECDRDVLPPGFVTTGTFRLPLGEVAADVAYVVLNPRQGIGYQLLAIP